MVKRGLILGGVLATFSVVSFSNNIYAAETGTTKFSVDLNQPVLELTVPANPAVINLEPVATGDSFGSTNIAIRVATNNITGYTLTMNPSNNVDNTSLIRTELLTEEVNYRTIGTLAQTDPVSAGYTEQSFTANKWGYKITGDNYYGIDPNNTTVSHPAWVGNDPTNGTNHNLTLGVKINANTVSGSYQTTLNFRAVTNAVVAKDTVTFNGNGASGSMDDLIVSAGVTVTLPANTFTAPNGYRFAGWSTTSDGLGDDVRYYGDSSTYTAIDTGVSKQVILYAQWTTLPACTSGCDVDPEHIPSGGTVGTTFARAYEIAYTAMHKGMYEQVSADSTHYEEVTDGQYKNLDVRFAMQDMTPEICASVTAMHDDYGALDLRDDKIYHITKLKDGRCWMTQNLDYDITGPMTSVDSDINLYGAQSYTSNYGYSIDGNGVITWTPDLLTISSSSILDDGTFPDWLDDASSTRHPNSLDVGNWYITGDPTITTACNFLIESCPTIAKQTPFENNGTHGHVGNYYSWLATGASNFDSYRGRCDYSPNDCDYAEAEKAPKNSICPKGWRIPYVTPRFPDDNEYAHLYSAYQPNGGDSNLISGAPSFVRGGSVNNSNKTIGSVGHNGAYWSGSYLGFWQTQYIRFYYSAPTSVTGERTSKYNNGMPVRCIAR